MASFACWVCLAAPSARSGTESPRAYAHRLALATWHSETEWRALDSIVRPESGWNPCKRFPSTTECSYAGSNSCGIPQANPCPAAWRGRLASTWREQVDWLIRYIRFHVCSGPPCTGRPYGDPLTALAFRELHGWY